jgi:hypothetical protein
VLERRQRLVGPADLVALDREAQEAAFTHRRDLAFGRVRLELEGAFEVPCDAAHHPLCSAFALDDNDQVVGVAREAVAAPFQLAVELVQHDVGQQRRQGPALRRADVARFDVLTDQALQAAPGQWPGPSPGTDSPLDCLCPGSAPARR